MFPMNLEDDLRIYRAGGRQLEVVNLFKKVTASVLIRPEWQPGDRIDDDAYNRFVLDPDGNQIVEVSKSGLLYVHWVIDRPDFFEEVRKRHLPEDKVLAGYIVITGETERYLAVAKCKRFRLG